MKKQLATVLIFAFSAACTVNMGTPANNSVSNTNPPAGNDPAVVKTERSTATDAGKNSKKTSIQSEDPAAAGQNPERIEFAAGKIDTNLTRTVPANGAIDFIFNARSGQRMQYSVNYQNGADTDIEAFLTEPGSQDIANTSAANENNEFMIKKTGDHRITVNNTTGIEVTVDFGLSVK